MVYLWESLGSASRSWSLGTRWQGPGPVQGAETGDHNRRRRLRDLIGRQSLLHRKVKWSVISLNRPLLSHRVIFFTWSVGHISLSDFTYALSKFVVTGILIANLSFQWNLPPCHELIADHWPLGERYVCDYLKRHIYSGLICPRNPLRTSTPCGLGGANGRCTACLTRAVLQMGFTAPKQQV